MIRSLIWPGFILLVLLQWWVPSKMIWQTEKILSDGTLYKFKTAPVDPNHPFLGKYITLNFQNDYYHAPPGYNLSPGRKAYVTFSKDKKGFAVITSVDTVAPAHTSYLETSVNYSSTEKGVTMVYVDLPFNRFYMEEYKAPRAERVYRETSIDSSQVAYALVSLLNGNAVVKDVFINDTSIQQILNKRTTVK